MTYSAAWLSKRSEEDERALLWARRMAGLFNDSRHPETNLGVARYSVLKQRMVWTGIGIWTHYGDRTRNIFGPEFGDAALDAYRLFSHTIVRRIYVEYALFQLAIAEDLGEQTSEFLEWTIDSLKAYAKYAYNPADNTFRPMLGDGTDLTGYEFKRGPQFGQSLEPIAADPVFLLPFARAWRLSDEEKLWNTVCGIIRGNNLGDIGDPGQGNGVIFRENSTVSKFVIPSIHCAIGLFVHSRSIFRQAGSVPEPQHNPERLTGHIVHN